MLVFGAGILTSVCSIMRAQSINQVRKDGNNWGLVAWGLGEMNSGVSLLPPDTQRLIAGN